MKSRIEEICYGQGMSVYRLSKETGIPTITFSAWKRRGSRRPPSAPCFGWHARWVCLWWTCNRMSEVSRPVPTGSCMVGTEREA